MCIYIYIYKTRGVTWFEAERLVHDGVRRCLPCRRVPVRRGRGGEKGRPRDAAAAAFRCVAVKCENGGGKRAESCVRETEVERVRCLQEHKVARCVTARRRCTLRAATAENHELEEESRRERADLSWRASEGCCCGWVRVGGVGGGG